MVTTKKAMGGYLLEEEQGRFLSITDTLGRKISLGNKVISGGGSGIFEPGGTIGVVERIFEPFTGGRTTDVIDVRFGQHRYPMKFKDLTLTLKA